MINKKEIRDQDKGGIQLPHYHPFGKDHAHALFIIFNK